VSFVGTATGGRPGLRGPGNGVPSK